MKKAINIDVRLYIEAEDEPAHDFAASTIATVKEVIAAGAARHPELTITVKKVREVGG